MNGSSKTSSSRFAEMYQRLILSPALIVLLAQLEVLRGVAPEVHDRRRPAQDLLGGALDVAGRGPTTSRSHWSGCSRNAFMPWAMALRVVSLPATDSSRKNRLKSMSDSDSPSTSALEQRGDDVVARLLAVLLGQLLGVHEHLDLGVERSPPRTPSTRGPRSRSCGCDHSKILWRSSCGTPMSSAITSSGSSAAMSTTKSDSPLASVLSRMPLVSSRMCSSIWPIIRGVKPRFTSLR